MTPSRPTHTLYSPATLRSGTPLTSEPFPIHGQYIEDVMHERNGRTKRKTLTQQMLDPRQCATNKRRNELLSNPLRLAFSRHRKWLGVTKTPFPQPPDATPITRDMIAVNEAPLALRVPLLRSRQCLACLKLTGMVAG